MRTQGYVTMTFLGGTSLMDAAREACSMADRLRSDVGFNFNGIEVIIEQLTDPTRAAVMIDAAMKDDLPFVRCFGRTLGTPLKAVGE